MRLESVRYCFAHSWLGVTKATSHVLLQPGRQNLLVTINSKFQFRTCRFLNLYCRFVWSARIPGKNNRRRPIPLTKSQWLNIERETGSDPGAQVGELWNNIISGQPARAKSSSWRGIHSHQWYCLRKKYICQWGTRLRLYWQSVVSTGLSISKMLRRRFYEVRWSLSWSRREITGRKGGNVSQRLTGTH